MEDETDPGACGRSEPPMNRDKPASETSQGISYLLADVFKDLYITEVIGKDTVSNLKKSRRGDDSYCDKYVEELQQLHSEYDRRIQEVKKMEAHIIQAREKTAEKEEHARIKMIEEVGDKYYELGLPPGKSTPGFCQPTFSYNMHICSEPQDDGYTVLPKPARTAKSLLDESEETLTFLSSVESRSVKGTSSEKLGQVRKALPKKGPSSQSRAEQKTALKEYKRRQEFLRNPRFLLPNAKKSLIVAGERLEDGTKDRKKNDSLSPEGPVPIFIANPPVIIFTDYSLGQVLETVVELKNTTATSRHIRMIPPTSQHFSVGLGRFPGEGGIVAPGMSCQYTVRFTPDSLADYEDVLVVETQSPYPLIIPVEAHRPPPILTLPSVLDCGYCLAGGVKFIEVFCRNEGLSPGTFCIMPKTQWPVPSVRSAVKAAFAEQPPFACSPTLFGLLPGEATVIEVVFFPTTAENSAQDFTIVCDNCQVKDITLQGTGQLAAVELVSVSGGEDQTGFGELSDLTADRFVRFESTNPHSTLQKTIIIKNHAHLKLPFHWQIMKPNLQSLFPGETPDLISIQHHVDTDGVFSISPDMGILAPAQDHRFLLTYSPKDLRDYHSVCHLQIEDVPDPPRVTENGMSLDTALHVNDVTVLEVEVKGSTEPFKILLEPYAVLIPGETLIHTPICKKFKMWNHSKSSICFEWERIFDSHVIEVKPSIGEIEMNECFDMELVLAGGKPGHFTTTLQCHIQHHPKPVGLAIEVTFKGPCCTVNVPSLDFGLLQLGDESISTIQITNNSLLDAHWSLQKLSNSQLFIERLVDIKPCKGVLSPLESCNVNIVFRALHCQSFESVLHLTVLNGNGCHLSVRADVQSPQVCLKSCELVLADLYVGVPQKGSVTIFNQTLLPSHFTWSKEVFLTLSYKAHKLISAPQPSARLPEELTEVNAVCKVEGMKNALVLRISSKAKPLAVSYSLPESDRVNSEDAERQPIRLDFSDQEPLLIGQSVERQLLMTNHTAVTAPFTVEVEYFKGSLQVAENVKRSSVPLHSAQAKQIQLKAYEEFVRCQLAYGKGAAFFIKPDSGILGPFERIIINITAFTNMWGDYHDNLMCKVCDLDPIAIPMQMSVRGCPIYFQMTGPQPDNQNQGPIIRFGSHVSGGDTVSRSLRLMNTSPCDIRMDWVTYNLEARDSKLLDLLVACGEHFPLKDADGNEVVGLDSCVMFPSTWDESQTPSREDTRSSVRTKSDGFEEHVQECGEEDNVSVSSVKKLFSVFLKPHEGSVSDYPYCITPQQTVVPAEGSSTIHLSFTPLILSGSTDRRCLGYALGFMSLDSKMVLLTPGKVERAQGYDLKPLRMDMQAYVKPAILSVQMKEDTDGLEFTAAASDALDRESHKQKESRITQTFLLKNNTEMTLSFRLTAHPPFSVLLPRQNIKPTGRSPSHRNTQGLSGPGDEQASLLLQPNQVMQVKVAFYNSASLLNCLNEPQEKCDAPLSATLHCNDTGERELQFKQSLTIQYSNNSVQTVSLCASLALPTLHLSSDFVDFGTCYVGQTHIKAVYLYNRGGSCSYWTALTVELVMCLDAEGGNEVFRVSPESGVLKHLEEPSSSRQLLQISFTASDQKDCQMIITVQGILGENQLILKVHGRGSFDEKFLSVISDA
ncbi:Deleted in lung and esophageal cancer protein 1 [Triplophysa tibetana]|uniref:Deleted in lung and esophageal cancer protein 1 n=1 Tax=Triplophysa tibetana TaxID=1572043 RepID=A0A5A9N4Y3_9TELE|nr:Deleted in lung and esophageal cancer protein 1 [Triplophysa tibetana]